MKKNIGILLCLLNFPLLSQNTPFKLGIYAQLNSSSLIISSTADPSRASSRSGQFWSAGGGLWLVTPDKKGLSLEFRAGVTTTGASESFYYNGKDNLWTRIYDRYQMISYSPTLRYHFPLRNPKVYVSGGYYGSWIFKTENRKSAFFPGPASSVILTPDPPQMLHAGIAEAGYISSRGEISLGFWRTFLPVIRSANVQSHIWCVSLTVKASIIDK